MAATMPEFVRKRRIGKDNRVAPVCARLVVAAGWLLVLAVIIAALTTVGDPATSVIAYFAVWMVSTTIPGVLVWRALAGPTTVVQELGFGSVAGVGLLLLAWLPAMLVGRPMLMWLWPVGIAAVFAVVPSLRRHWWPRRPSHLRTPARWHAAMMAVCGLGYVRLHLVTLQDQPLPPAPSVTFQDRWYELSLVHELARTAAVQDPAAVGVALNYHWFSAAHVAATHILSGLPAPMVLLHLWLVPMLLTLLFAVAASTERVLQSPVGREVRDGSWMAGPVAALLAGALPVAMFLGEPRLREIAGGLNPVSTSGVLALVVLLALVGPVSDLLQGRGSRGTWVLLVLLLAVGAGTKPSLLPVAACGGLAVLGCQWLRTRRLPVVPAVLALLPLVLIPVAAIAVIGSTGGSRLQLFQTLALDPAYRNAAGRAAGLPGHGGWLAPGLADGPGQVWTVAAGILGLYLLTELPRLIGLASLGSARLRADPGTWWCAGVVGSGFCGSWLLAHPGYSQQYFWRVVIPLAVVLTVTMIVRLLPEPPRRSAPALLAVVVAGFAVAAAVALADPESAESVKRRLVPYAVAAVVLAAVLLALRARAARTGRPPLPLVVVVAGFTCAVAATAATIELGRSAGDAGPDSPGTGTARARYVSGAEQRAALWLHEHSRPDDIVATNVFCQPPPYRPRCRSSAFWVAGLSGRQMLVGAWAYTEPNLAAYGRQGDVPYQRLDSPWPDRVDLSLRAVQSPTSEVMSGLATRGVRWILADRRATAVSPRLGDYATLRYRNDEVLIYRLADDDRAQPAPR